MFVKTTLVILVILINGGHSWPRVTEEDLGYLGHTLPRPRAWEEPPQNQLDSDTLLILGGGFLGVCLLFGLCCCCSFICQAAEPTQPEVITVRRPTRLFHPQIVIGQVNQPCCPAGQEPPQLEQFPKVVDLTPKPVLLEQFSKVQDLI